MKKLNVLFHAVSIVGLIVLGYIMFQRNIKVAYVDNNVLLSKYQGMIDARKEFEKKAAQWQANADTLLEGWKTELQVYEKERSGMTKKERELKEELLRNKQVQINQYREATQMKAQEEEKKMSQTAVNDINDEITAYGKKHGYTYILGASGGGNLVYAKESENVTQEILEILNQKYKAE